MKRFLKLTHLQLCIAMFVFRYRKDLESMLLGHCDPKVYKQLCAELYTLYELFISYNLYISDSYPIRCIVNYIWIRPRSFPTEHFYAITYNLTRLHRDGLPNHSPDGTVISISDDWYRSINILSKYAIGVDLSYLIDITPKW